MGTFLKRIFQIIAALVLLFVGFVFVQNSADKFSTREVTMKCTLHQLTEKTQALFAETIDGPRNGDDGPWSDYMPDFRILPEEYIEIRNDWINGQKLIRRVDNTGTEQTGFTDFRRLSETTTEYETGFWKRDWSTNIIINRETLAYTETFRMPPNYSDQWWSRKCMVIDGVEFDKYHKSVVKRVTSKQKI